MKPNEILKVAVENNLDFIAICDHNSVKQLESFKKIKEQYNIIIVPGVEVTVNEGYHVVCLFPNFDKAIEFGNVLDANLNPVFHDLSKLGEQIIYDEFDQIKETKIDVSLQQNTNITIPMLRKFVNEFGAIMFLAHIERYDAFIYDKVETIYKNMFDMIEINARSDYETIIKEHPNLMKYLIIRDSDAHSLEIINKQKFSFELEDKSIESLFIFILAK
jgi:PHP family Zn ribbon phosphoesterase